MESGFGTTSKCDHSTSILDCCPELFSVFVPYDIMI